MSTMLIPPVCVPFAVGEYVTSRKQLLPAATVVQLLVWLNGPLAVMAPKCKAELPALLITTVCGPLVVSTG